MSEISKLDQNLIIRKIDSETINLQITDNTMLMSIVGQFDPPAFDEGCVSAVREAAEELGYSHMDIISGAGHDACWINDLAPTAMIMCPCEDGLSHNEAEEISKEWAQAGTDVLLHAVLNTAIIQ